MKKNEIRRLLAMLADPDTDPSTFNFVLERIMGAIYGAESDGTRGVSDAQTTLQLLPSF
tara:strand:+ start:1377 stop:1553 length:177 start_codon:yes stop_codon:yes gene_type:complete